MRKPSTPKENITPAIDTGSTPWRLVAVEPLPDFKLSVVFVDGTTGTVDLNGLIFSEKAGVFSVLQDISIFNDVYINYGVVTWPGELDLAPDAMYEAIKQSGEWQVI